MSASSGSTKVRRNLYELRLALLCLARARLAAAPPPPPADDEKEEEEGDTGDTPPLARSGVVPQLLLLLRCSAWAWGVRRGLPAVAAALSAAACRAAMAVFLWAAVVSSADASWLPLTTMTLPRKSTCQTDST